MQQTLKLFRKMISSVFFSGTGPFKLDCFRKRCRPEWLCLILLIAVISDGRPAEAAEEKSVEALADGLEQGNTEVRRRAAQQLSRKGPDAVEALPSLIEALNDADRSVKRVSVQDYIKLCYSFP